VSSNRSAYLFKSVPNLSCSDPVRLVHSLTISDVDAGTYFTSRNYLLLCHVEAPLTTAAIILIPRVLQQRWQGMSNVVVEIGIYQRDEVPIVCHTHLTIPVVILLIPYHV
jgi:hypothetical protein